MSTSDFSHRRIVILAGPNGAGKTTLAVPLLGAWGIEHSLNADDLAKGLSGMHPDKAAFEASELLLRKISDHVSRGLSFGFETTLAPRTWIQRIRCWKAAGYEVVILFVWIAHPDLAVARVASRVSDGGHSIPEDTIRRRYERSVGNFMRHYYSVADHWRVYNNSLGDPIGSTLVAEGRFDSVDRIEDAVAWNAMQKVAGAR